VTLHEQIPVNGRGPASGDATRRHLPMQLATQIGRELQARWRAVRNDHRRFPDLAVEVLEEFSPAEKLTAEDFVRGLFTDDVLTIQTDPEAKFGDASITLFRGREFHIAVLFWLDSRTSVHQHGFSGAFQVLSGSSVHARYRFEQTRYLDDHVHLGRMELADLEVLERGDVRPILPGDAYMHALWHLERPSVTFIVRENIRSSAQPQHGYLPPCVEYNPFFIDDVTTTRLQMLHVLQRSKDPLVGEMVEAVGQEGAPLPIVRVAQWARNAPAEFGQRLVEAVRKGDAEYADALDCALGELEREGRISLVRDRVTDTDQRLLLGLLLHCPDRDQILRHVARLRPSADPAELVGGWIASITAATHKVELSAAGRAALSAKLRCRLAGQSPADDHQLPPDDARVLRYITRRSQVFAPLFPESQDRSRMPPIVSASASRLAPASGSADAIAPHAFSVDEILSPSDHAELLDWARDRIDDFVAEAVVRPAGDGSGRFTTISFATLDELGEWQHRISPRIQARFVESSPSVAGTVDVRLITWRSDDPMELTGGPDGGTGFLVVLDDAGVRPVIRVYGAASLGEAVTPTDEFLEIDAPANTAGVFPGALTAVVQPAGDGHAAPRRFALVGRVAPE
jgi:hypothetical protein